MTDEETEEEEEREKELVKEEDEEVRKKMWWKGEKKEKKKCKGHTTDISTVRGTRLTARSLVSLAWSHFGVSHKTGRIQ